MQQVLIDDTLLNEAAHCLSLEDTNEVVSIALRELINNHPFLKNVVSHRFILPVKAKL
jgi:hypothetical protein